MKSKTTTWHILVYPYSKVYRFIAVADLLFNVHGKHMSCWDGQLT